VETSGQTDTTEFITWTYSFLANATSNKIYRPGAARRYAPADGSPIQKSRLIYVRPRTGTQSAHLWCRRCQAAGSQRAYSLGWDRQTDRQTEESRYRLMLPPTAGGIIMATIPAAEYDLGLRKPVTHIFVSTGLQCGSNVPIKTALCQKSLKIVLPITNFISNDYSRGLSTLIYRFYQNVLTIIELATTLLQ